MFKRKSVCSVCEKTIQADEEIYVKMHYPKQAIMVEIKAYLNKKSEIICKTCFEKSRV